MKELICIVCPNGCHLKVDPENGYAVTGNKCDRGIEYGKAELQNPVRMVTSTVILEGANSRRLPVKTSAPVPKNMIFRVMEKIDTLTVCAPVKTGDVLLKNVLNTGADIVACKNVEA